jgi:hypothetical protein
MHMPGLIDKSMETLIKYATKAAVESPTTAVRTAIVAEAKIRK